MERGMERERRRVGAARVLAMTVAAGMGVAALLLPGPGAAWAVEPDAPEALLSRDEAVSVRLRARLAGKMRVHDRYDQPGQRLREQRGLKAFYKENGYRPLWVGEHGLNSKARAVIEALAAVDKYGLIPADYRVPDADKVAQDLKAPEAAGADILAAAEVRMSLAVLQYASHASGGRVVPAKYSKNIDRRGEPVPPLTVMKELAAADDGAAAVAYLEGLHPKHPQYAKLMRELARLRDGKDDNQHVMLPAGPKLQLGVRHPHVALLRRRLRVPAQGEADAEHFDESVAAAVRAFQSAHGLKADGIIGPRTRRVLNRKDADHKQTLLVNLERWRWMPRELGRKYIWVNLPEYSIRVVRDGAVVHKERVVIGKRTQKTPVFSDEMESVVFNPYWHVPQSIIWTEMGGRIPRGYEGEWRNGRLSVRQPPGPKNALGKIKFLFPNKHAVYLHDTPKKQLFNRNERAFSHGCMRVRNPIRLAHMVFQDEPRWGRTRVDAAFRSNINREVRLSRKIPVHVTYFTAWAEEDGRLRYFKDLYGHDRRMLKALKYVPGDPYAPDPVEAAAKARLKAQERYHRNRRRNDYYGGYYYGPPANSLFGAIFGWAN